MTYQDLHFNEATLFEIFVYPFDTTKPPRRWQHTLAELGTMHPMESLVREAWCQAAVVEDGHEVIAMIDGLPVARFKTDHGLRHL